MARDIYHQIVKNALEADNWTYQSVITSLLQKFENERDTYVISDVIRHHYQVMRAGRDSHGVYFVRIRLHLHIKSDGKIWILENRTEDDIAELLVKNNIPPSDIVLALLPEHARQYSGYAVA
jgi:XisI protein